VVVSLLAFAQLLLLDSGAKHTLLLVLQGEARPHRAFAFGLVVVVVGKEWR